jgi:ferredoxin-NADP reductase
MIAGGIGITPIKAMAQALKRRNVSLELHYTGRNALDMAYHEQLSAEFTSGYFTYYSRAQERQHLDVAEVMWRAAGDAVFYVCGPVALIESVRAAANQLGIAPERVQHESFY